MRYKNYKKVIIRPILRMNCDTGVVTQEDLRILIIGGYVKGSKDTSPYEVYELRSECFTKDNWRVPFRKKNRLVSNSFTRKEMENVIIDFYNVEFMSASYNLWDEDLIARKRVLQDEFDERDLKLTEWEEMLKISHDAQEKNWRIQMIMMIASISLLSISIALLLTI